MLTGGSTSYVCPYRLSYYRFVVTIDLQRTVFAPWAWQRQTDGQIAASLTAHTPSVAGQHNNNVHDNPAVTSLTSDVAQITKDTDSCLSKKLISKYAHYYLHINYMAHPETQTAGKLFWHAPC